MKSTDPNIRGRFAPTPSGRMHLGNLCLALLSWLDIRSQGGEMLLRMEDLDTERCRKEYIPQLAEDLLWLGLDWDVGWRAGEDAYLQSSRSRHYKEALAILEKKGLLYYVYSFH